MRRPESLWDEDMCFTLASQVSLEANRRVIISGCPPYSIVLLLPLLLLLLLLLILLLIVSGCLLRLPPALGSESSQTFVGWSLGWVLNQSFLYDFRILSSQNRTLILHLDWHTVSFPWNYFNKALANPTQCSKGPIGVTWLPVGQTLLESVSCF